MIVASDINGIIGHKGQIPWGMNKVDMARFRAKTLNSSVIMGRKTWESIGRPLPKRRNIVISRTTKSIDNVEVVDSLMGAVKLAAKDDNAIWVIGGGEVYREALTTRLVDIIDHTIINLATNVGNGEIDQQSMVTYLPTIPLYYHFISEELNGEDPLLQHRTYIIRSNWKRDA